MRYLSIFFLVFIFSCQNSSEEQLSLIPADETIERVKAGNFDYSYAEFKNAEGGELSEEERSLLNQGKLAKDYYENEEGVIKEVRVRPINLEDKFVEIQRRELVINPLSEIELIDIDCSKLDSIYNEVYSSDQEVRNTGGDMGPVDERNQQVVISAINACGWTQKHLHTIWIVFQHSPSGIMTYYFSKLKALAEEGKLSKSSMALMEDRMLLRNGYKQIYGSQIGPEGVRDLKNPDSVNYRREEVGLAPIEEYIEHWDLDWEEEKERLKQEEK